MLTRIRYSLVWPVLVAALVATAADASEPLKVVTTTTDLAAIARAVGGDKVEVTAIATGREDPHFIAAKPSYMMAARNADLWIRVGMELEIGYEGLILDGSRSSKIRIGTPGHLDASEGVLRLEVPTQRIDRSMGDVHPLGNPHYLLDPLNGRIVAKSIGKRLASLAPEHASYFDEQVKRFQRQLDERMFGRELVAKSGGGKLWAALLKNRLNELLNGPGQPALGGWLGTMRSHTGKKLITYHRNWSYFVHRFGLVVVMELEPKPGIPPSPGRLTEVMGRVKTQDIKVLLMANYFSRKAPNLLAEQTGITTVECPMFPDAWQEEHDYLLLFDHIVERLCAVFGQSPGAPASPEGDE